MFAELQGRTEPNLHDIASSLIEIGEANALTHSCINLEAIPFSFQNQHLVLKGIDLQSLLKYTSRASHRHFMKIQARALTFLRLNQIHLIILII